jgi:hypothetical protein
MAVSIVITADLNSNCGYAKIVDNSIYSAVPDSRADFGIAIFVEENGSLNYSLSDLTNSDPWYVSIVNHIPYEIFAFQVPVWSADAPYAVHALVYHITTGLFYHNTNIAGTSDVPGTGTDWVVIPNNIAGYGVFNTYATSKTSLTLQQDCPDYTLSKVECDDVATCCKTWRVCDNSGNLDEKLISLFDYNGMFINSYELNPATSVCVDIIVPDSKVYIVGIDSDLSNDVNEENINNYSEFLVIYEYCQLSHCAQYLLDQILCSNDPCAEVCNPCNQDKIIKQQNARTEINRLSWMFLTLMGMINAERIKYLGLYDMNATRFNFVTKIGLYMTKINDIAIRCGICTSSSVAASDNPIFQNVIETSTGRSSGCTECNQ